MKVRACNEINPRREAVGGQTTRWSRRRPGNKVKLPSFRN